MIFIPEPVSLGGFCPFMFNLVSRFAILNLQFTLDLLSTPLDLIRDYNWTGAERLTERQFFV